MNWIMPICKSFVSINAMVAHAADPGPCAIIRAMHVVLLRLALGLYSVGFAHSVLTALNKKQTFFRPALVAVSSDLCCM